MLQPDPAGVDFGTNPYIYEGNNLQAFGDPSGNVAVAIILAAMAIGALIGAATALVVDLARQFVGLISHEQDEFNWTELWCAIGIGAVAGALAAIPGVGPHLAVDRSGARARFRGPRISKRPQRFSDVRFGGEPSHPDTSGAKPAGPGQARAIFFRREGSISRQRALGESVAAVGRV